MNWGALSAAPTMVQVHVWAALAAALIGAVQLAGPKGTLPHRVLGYTWVAVMAATALASIAMIGTCALSGLTPIHALTAYTLVMLPVAVIHARRGRIAAHRSSMLWLFGGAIIVAGAFTVTPGRLMHDVAFGTSLSRTACAG